MVQKYTKMVITLPKELKEEIDKIAKERDIKKSSIVRQALRKYLEELKKHG